MSDPFDTKPPKPPAPPFQHAIPTTEASIVVDETLLLAQRLDDLTARLHAKLEPFSTPALAREERPPSPVLKSAYFSVQFNRIEDMMQCADAIEALLNRLAI